MTCIAERWGFARVLLWVRGLLESGLNSFSQQQLSLAKQCNLLVHVASDPPKRDHSRTKTTVAVYGILLVLYPTIF